MNMKYVIFFTGTMKICFEQKMEEYNELSKMRNTDARRDLPGVRLPYQPCKKKKKT